MNKDKSHTYGEFSFCKGIGSMVKGPDVPKNQNHVIQYDIEDLSLESLIKALQQEAPTGPYIIAKNRGVDGSWHVSSLRLFSLSEVAQHKANINADDANHLKIGLQRGYWISRISGKGERPAPEFQEIFYVDGLAPARYPMSRPHAETYAELFRDKDLRSVLPAGNYVGNSLDLEHYPTRSKTE